MDPEPPETRPPQFQQNPSFSHRRAPQVVQNAVCGPFAAAPAGAGAAPAVGGAAEVGFGAAARAGLDPARGGAGPTTGAVPSKFAPHSLH